MALKIRLRQQGCNNRTVYRLVVTDCRSPRDGKYLEALGWYNPIETEAEKSFFMKPDRVQHWLDLGAQLTESVECLILKASPSIVHRLTQKKVANRAKQTAKRKARKQAVAS